MGRYHRTRWGTITTTMRGTRSRVHLEGRASQSCPWRRCALEPLTSAPPPLTSSLPPLVASSLPPL
eukprot:3820501-Pyramimonas_sp.AAC.1